MTDGDKNTLKIKAEYDYVDGILKINIPDIIAELPLEDREELARLHLFDSAMWEELKANLLHNLTSENYNSLIHRLRIELLTGDGSDEILRRTVWGILFDKNSAQTEAKRFNDAYWKLWHWCSSSMSHSQRRSMPRSPEYETTPQVTDKDVDAAIAPKKE